MHSLGQTDSCSSSVVILLFIVYSKRRRPDPYLAGVDPDDDVRENIINYDEEGVGGCHSLVLDSVLYQTVACFYFHSNRRGRSGCL